MDFTAFDTQKIKDYAAQAKQQWGATPEYKEFEQRPPSRRKRGFRFGRPADGNHCSFR